MEGELTQTGIKAIIAPIVWIAITGLAFFLSAGTLFVNQAWIYIGFYIISSLVSSFILYIKTPALLNDRGRWKEGKNKRDMYFLFFYFFFVTIITPVLGGLGYRYEILLLPNCYLYIGIFLLIISAIIMTMAMLQDKFMDGATRIQKENEHQKINKGLYQIVRHPRHLGILIGSLALPFALGSELSFIPVPIVIVIVFFRTYAEDIALQKESPEYLQYCEVVKYRLFPYIW